MQIMASLFDGPFITCGSAYLLRTYTSVETKNMRLKWNSARSEEQCRASCVCYVHKRIEMQVGWGGGPLI